MGLLDLGRGSSDTPSRESHLRAVERLLDGMGGGRGSEQRDDRRRGDREPTRSRAQRSARGRGGQNVSGVERVTLKDPVETDVSAFENDLLRDL